MAGQVVAVEAEVVVPSRRLAKGPQMALAPMQSFFLAVAGCVAPTFERAKGPRMACVPTQRLFLAASRKLGVFREDSPAHLLLRSIDQAFVLAEAVQALVLVEPPDVLLERQA